MNEFVRNGSLQKAGVIPGQPQPEPVKDKKKPAEPKGPSRLPSKPRIDVADYAVPAFAVATAGLVAVSAPQLIDASGVIGAVKVGLVAVGGGGVSYMVNRSAIEQGAELTARGYRSAGVVSVVAMLIVGGGLWASTYAGLTLDRVRALMEQQYHQHNIEYVGALNAQAMKTAQIKPVMDAAVADFQLHVACENRENCLSKSGRAGRGPVTRTLEPLAARTAEMSLQLQKGDSARAAHLTNLNKLLSEYQGTMGDGDLSSTERRQRLSKTAAQINQEAGALKEAIPLPLIRGFAGELGAGVSIAGQPEATRNVNALLTRHGDTIGKVLDGMDRKPIAAPTFPGEPGVSSTIAYIAHFLPIAALCAAIELVMPLTLWVFVLIAHLWRFYEDDPPTSGDGPSAPLAPASMNGARHD